MPVPEVAARLRHGPGRHRTAELQQRSGDSGPVGRVVTYPTRRRAEDGDASRWMPWDAALALWAATWSLLDAFEEEPC